MYCIAQLITSLRRDLKGFGSNPQNNPKLFNNYVMIANIYIVYQRKKYNVNW